MKYLALFVLIVVVLAAWAGVTGTDTGWWPGSHAGQFQGMHHGMHGMMGRSRGCSRRCAGGARPVRMQLLSRAA